jgi:hypothetical protein
VHVCIGCFVAEVVYFLIASEEESLARSIKEPFKDVVNFAVVRFLHQR